MVAVTSEGLSTTTNVQATTPCVSSSNVGFWVFYLAYFVAIVVRLVGNSLVVGRGPQNTNNAHDNQLSPVQFGCSRFPDITPSDSSCPCFSSDPTSFWLVRASYVQIMHHWKRNNCYPHCIGVDSNFDVFGKTQRFAEADVACHTSEKIKCPFWNSCNVVDSVTHNFAFHCSRWL